MLAKLRFEFGPPGTPACSHCDLLDCLLVQTLLYEKYIAYLRKLKFSKAQEFVCFLFFLSKIASTFFRD